MNRKYIKQNKDMIIAFAEGKTIQERRKGTIEWRDTEDPHFDATWAEYRVKPESKYRPFLNQEECWEEMHKHPDFGWLYYKDKGYYVNIGAIGDRVGMSGQKFAEAYNSYTFTDNEPFGIKEG